MRPKKIHEIQWDRVFKKIIKSYLVGLIVLLSAEAIYFRIFVDVEDSVQYRNVLSSKDEYKIGKDRLSFRSSFVIKKDGVDLVWEDILFCDVEPPGFTHYSTYRSEKSNAEAEILDESEPWNYWAEYPQEESECYLRSTTFVSYPVFLVFKYKKPHKTIYSNHFTFIK